MTTRTYSKPESAGFYCVAETSDGKRYSGRYTPHYDQHCEYATALRDAFNGAPYFMWEAFYPIAHGAPAWESLSINGEV